MRCDIIANQSSKGRGEEMATRTKKTKRYPQNQKTEKPLPNRHTPPKHGGPYSPRAMADCSLSNTPARRHGHQMDESNTAERATLQTRPGKVMECRISSSPPGRKPRKKKIAS
ncbi:hypothetical protein ACRALDRAFT_213311 [Sodiomyces alcalophilus JCM 7366]|uniref:uncharacterized protein n=1 Tax=Sodiomyces alcalophilus JCM 7366 TaxID=591952 RepID=UPI0039B568BF